MGQFVSKAVKGGKGGAPAATASARNQAANIPTSNVSATAAAAEAATDVRSPSFVTPPSAQDLTQRQVLQQTFTQQAGPSPVASSAKPDENSTAHEMPEDLVNFLQQAGPLQKQDAGSTAATTPRQRPHKMPRSALSKEEDDNNPNSATTTVGRRVVESMPLAEKIAGFETTKSTSFSKQTPEVDPHVYQWGTTLNIYQLLKHKENIRKPAADAEDTEEDQAAADSAYEDIVQQTYQAYSQQFALPPPDVVQQQQTWLKHTLRYLDIPVLMKDDKDNADSYDGIPPAHVTTYENMKLHVLPPTRARLVLEDLNDMEQEQAQAAPPSQKKEY